MSASWEVWAALGILAWLVVCAALTGVWILVVLVSERYYRWQRRRRVRARGGMVGLTAGERRHEPRVLTFGDKPAGGETWGRT